jgi:hypothetical protein
MPNKLVSRLFFFYIFICYTIALHAQVTTLKGDAPAAPAVIAMDSFLSKTISPALYIIRVDYVMRENNKPDPQDFGRDTLPYFGRVHGVAVASDGRYWFDPRLLLPWMHADSANYNEIKDEELYQPVVKKIQFRPIQGRKFETYTFHADSLQVDSRSSASLPMEKPILGLLPVILQSDTSTLLLLVSSESAQRMEYSDTATVKMEVANGSVTFNEEGKGTYKLPLISRLKPPMGGVLCAIKTYTGRLEVSFAGILTSSSGRNGEMHLLPPSYGIVTDPAAPPPAPKSVLMPIHKDSNAPNKPTPQGGSAGKSNKKQKNN